MRCLQLLDYSDEMHICESYSGMQHNNLIKTSSIDAYLELDMRADGSSPQFLGRGACLGRKRTWPARPPNVHQSSPHPPPIDTSKRIPQHMANNSHCDRCSIRTDKQRSMFVLTLDRRTYARPLGIIRLLNLTEYAFYLGSNRPMDRRR